MNFCVHLIHNFEIGDRFLPPFFRDPKRARFRRCFVPDQVLHSESAGNKGAPERRSSPRFRADCTSVLPGFDLILLIVSRSKEFVTNLFI
jgi:hypothetical protein